MTASICLQVPRPLTWLRPPHELVCFSQTANFHLAAADAHRPRTKRSETGMAVFESFERQFAATAPAPRRDFRLVARVPAGGEAGRSSTAFALRLLAEFRLGVGADSGTSRRLGASLGMTTLWSKDQC
jgi:hypothetical protein